MESRLPLVAVTEPPKYSCLGGALLWQLTPRASHWHRCWILDGMVQPKNFAVPRRTFLLTLGFHHVMLEALNNVLTAGLYHKAERDRFRDSTNHMMKIGLSDDPYRLCKSTEVLGMVATRSPSERG